MDQRRLRRIGSRGFDQGCVAQQPKRKLDAWPDGDREGQCAETDRAARGGASGERRQLECGANQAEPKPRPARTDQHQRVPWSCAYARTDVQGCPHAHQWQADGEQPGPDGQRLVADGRDGMWRREELDESADEECIGDRANTDCRAKQPGSRDHDHADGDVRLAEGELGVSGDPLVQDVPRGKPETGLEQGDDAGGEDEQTEHEHDESEPETAAYARRSVHLLHS